MGEGGIEFDNMFVGFGFDWGKRLVGSVEIGVGFVWDDGMM